MVYILKLFALTLFVVSVIMLIEVFRTDNENNSENDKEKK